MKVPIGSGHDLVLHRSILRAPIDAVRRSVGVPVPDKRRTLVEHLRPLEIRRRPAPTASEIPPRLPLSVLPVPTFHAEDVVRSAFAIAQATVKAASGAAHSQPEGTPTAGPSAQGPTPAKLPPIFVNPALATVKSGSLKQYTVHGVPVAAPYRQLPRGPLPEHAVERRFIGSGKFNVVHTRRNPAATVLVKRSIHAADMDEIRLRCRVLNELAQCLAAPGAERFRNHFAPEILKEVDATGRAVFYTPLVNGFSLDRYFEHPEMFSPLVSARKLWRESTRLQNAIRWLFSKGLLHGDPNPGNIMYDLGLRKLVLIDFDCINQTTDPDDLQQCLDLVEHRVKARLGYAHP